MSLNISMIIINRIMSSRFWHLKKRGDEATGDELELLDGRVYTASAKTSKIAAAASVIVHGRLRTLATGRLELKVCDVDVSCRGAQRNDKRNVYWYSVPEAVLCSSRLDLEVICWR